MLNMRIDQLQFCRTISRLQVKQMHLATPTRATPKLALRAC
jgi:hypothetical protein